MLNLKFCASVYDYKVNLSEYIDKFTRCKVRMEFTCTSDYNSSKRGSVMITMFVLSGTHSLE